MKKSALFAAVLALGFVAGTPVDGNEKFDKENVEYLLQDDVFGEDTAALDEDLQIVCGDNECGDDCCSFDGEDDAEPLLLCACDAETESDSDDESSILLLATNEESVNEDL